MATMMIRPDPNSKKLLLSAMDRQISDGLTFWLGFCHLAFRDAARQHRETISADCL